MKPKLLALAVLALLSSSSFAAVHYTGTPDAQIPVLKTYGVDVPIRSGLKSVLPQGWTLFIHKSANLPELMSWKPGDPWTQALEELAGQQNLTLRVDWERKTVTIEPGALSGKTETAVAASGTSAPPVTASTLAAGTSTPVQPGNTTATAGAAVTATALTPALAQASAKPASQPVASPPIAIAAPAGVAPAAAVMPAIRPAAPVATTASVASVAREPVRLDSGFPQSSAHAQVGGSAHEVVEQLAARFNYVLSWEAPDAQIPGALTLLGVDIAEDVKLLQNALGEQQTPLAIEIYRSSAVIRVMPRSLSSRAVTLVDEPYNGPVSRQLLAARARTTQASSQGAASVVPQNLRPVPQPTAHPVAQVTGASASTPVALAESSATTAAPAVTFSVLKGDSLASDLKAFFLGQGWDMQWRASADLQATYPVAITAADPKQVMNKLLPKLGLVADFYNPSKLVVIRSADATTN